MILRLFLKRIIARKKTFLVVSIGILLACTTLSGSIMYFESLRNLALDYTFSKIDSSQLDIKFITKIHCGFRIFYRRISHILLRLLALNEFNKKKANQLKHIIF